MKKKLASIALCATIALNLAPAASATFSVTSAYQRGMPWQQTQSYCYYPYKCAPSTGAGTGSTGGSGQTGAAQSAQMTAFEKRVVELVNEVRVKNGLRALSADSELTRIARVKSQDMRDKRYFSHQSPTYGSPYDLLARYGVTYRAAGENIAMGYRTAELVVNGWMNSPSHRANILKASYTHIGVGHVADGNYWTQLFIAR